MNSGGTPDSRLRGSDLNGKHHFIKNLQRLCIPTARIQGARPDPEQNVKAMNPDRQTWRLLCLAVMAACWATCVFVPEPSIASEREPSTTVEQNTERLACLDAVADPKGQGAPIEVTSEERSLIIARCLSQTGEFGSAMARKCVQHDLAAYEALLAYPEACASFVVPCAKRLGQHGWGMVKICVDKGIEAERPPAD